MAIAHVLCTHPHGLPWKDIARIVNHNKLGRVKFSTRKRDYAFSACDLVYLCNNGCYRHTMFLKLTDELVQAVLAAVHAYLETRAAASENLQIIHASLQSAFPIDYYTLRYIVNSLGEEAGLHFVGKSRVDTVSLSKAPAGVSAPEVIMRLLSQSPDPLTISEIAQQLRSKSYAFAANHLFRLEEAGQVVRVDRSFFAPADKALEGIDTKSIGDAIDRILESSTIPVEADVFRERIGISNRVRKSKYFFASLANLLAKDYGWHNCRLLFSKHSIPYHSLRALVLDTFDPDRTNQQIVDAIRQKVLITDRMAAGSVRSWLSAARTSSQPVVNRASLSFGQLESAEQVGKVSLGLPAAGGIESEEQKRRPQGVCDMERL
jgi:DNA-binding transcriptional ArsR family regulator